MVNLISGSDTPSPVVVEGFVTDTVLGNTMEKPIVSITIKGNVINGNTALNSPGKHDRGHYDGVITGLAGDSVSVSVYDKDNPSCRGVVSKLLTGDGKLILDVPICCYPTSASGLNPNKPLHLTSPTEIVFSWAEGVKGNSNYPDLWQIFKGPQSIIDPSNPLKLTLSNLDGWNIQTCSGIKNSNSFCCSEKGVGVGYKNNPCAAPKNLKGEFKEGFIITTWDSDPKDSDGDNCHDEWKASSMKKEDSLSNPSWTNLVNNANKQGELATAYLVTSWQVRSCDDQKRPDSCSEWVDAITTSCNEVSSECPNVKGISEYLGGYGTKLSTEIYCNGIKINDGDLIKKIDLRITSNKKEINILGLKSNKYNLESCPWCYDKIKDYDETGIDCGGSSCPSCQIISETNFKFWKILLFFGIILLLILAIVIFLIIYFLKREPCREVGKARQLLENEVFKDKKTGAGFHLSLNDDIIIREAYKLKGNSKVYRVIDLTTGKKGIYYSSGDNIYSNYERNWIEKITLTPIKYKGIMNANQKEMNTMELLNRGKLPDNAVSITPAVDIRFIDRYSTILGKLGKNVGIGDVYIKRSRSAGFGDGDGVYSLDPKTIDWVGLHRGISEGKTLTPEEFVKLISGENTFVEVVPYGYGNKMADGTIKSDISKNGGFNWKIYDSRGKVVGKMIRKDGPKEKVLLYGPRGDKIGEYKSIIESKQVFEGKPLYKWFKTSKMLFA